jgi:hypothetical protein
MLAVSVNFIEDIPEDWKVDPVNVRLDVLWIDTEKMAYLAVDVSMPAACRRMSVSPLPRRLW